jgi:serine/threonine protein kinase
MLKGTPSYMAPELFEGKPFNKSVDTFALGIIMWEIFARDQPWSMMNVSSIEYIYIYI